MQAHLTLQASALNLCVILFEVFDIETTNKHGVLKPHSIAWSEGCKFFYRKVAHGDELAELILREFHRDRIYYAHNLMFDMSFMLFSFLKLKTAGIVKNITWLCIDFDLYWIKLEDWLGGLIHFKCSYRLLPWSLGSFFPEISDLPKIKFPYQELEDWEPGKLITVEDGEALYTDSAETCLQLYAVRDCKILKNALTAVWQLINSLKLNIQPQKIHSIGGLSLAIFKKLNQKHVNCLELKLPAEQINVLWPAYRGGRCEVFGNPREGEKILHFDFPGMYHSCLYGKFPLKKLKYCANPTDITAPGFYRIKIEYFDYLPVLPVKNDKLLFPVGTVEGLFWHEEIEIALKSSDVKNFTIYNAWLAQDYANCFEEYAGLLAEWRATKAYRSLAKKLANSLYGRLGMSGDLILTKLPSIYDKDPKHGIYAEYAEYGNLQLTNQAIKQQPRANIAVAAIITSRARIKLYNALQSIRAAHGRPLYCDTDSVIAAFEPNNQVENRSIGEVYFDTAKPDTCLTKAIFIAPKTYALITKNNEEIIKIKGVQTASISYAQLQEAFIKKTAIRTTKTSLTREGLEYKLRIEEVHIETSTYSKRKWNTDRTDTTPITNDASV